MDQKLFHTFKTGKLTVIGFEGKHLLGNQVDHCRDELLELIDHNECEYLIVDLMDVPIVCSWVLGILAAIHAEGVHVELYHPTVDMRDVLATTHLDTLLHIREE